MSQAPTNERQGAALLHCAIHPAADGTRARHLAAQLLGMIGFPFGFGRLGEPEPGAAKARVTILPPGATDTTATDGTPTLAIVLGKPWDDPAAVRVAWRGGLPLLHLESAGAPAALLDGDRVTADVLGALEFLLEGEERLITERDERGRFRAAFSVLDDLGLSYAPPIDRVAAALRHSLAEHAPALGTTGWGDDAAFLVALTHDVDGIFDARPQRRKIGHLLRAGLAARSGLAFERAVTEVARLALRGPRPGPPGFNFGSWLSFERRAGVRSTYHVFADYEAGRHTDDAWYTYAERGRLDGRVLAFGDALRTLAVEGFEIGLHTSIASFADDARVARELASVARAAGAPVRSARAHHLRFDTVRSGPGYAAAGITQDSSMSGVGFVRGSGFPFRLAGAGRLLELPTVVQDDHLLKDWRLGLPGPLAERKVARVLGEVRDAGGGAAILFHTDQDTKLALYEWIVDWIRGHRGRCVTAAELGDRWRQRSAPRYGA